MNRILLFALSLLFFPFSFVFSSHVVRAEIILTVALEQENIRIAPNQKVLGVVFQGTPLQQIKVQEAWTRVRFEGWVKTRALFPLKRNKKLYSLQEQTSVYASIKGKIGGNLNPQASVVKMKSQKEWSFIRIEAWMWNGSLAKQSPEFMQEIASLNHSVGIPPQPPQAPQEARVFLDRLHFFDWTQGRYIRANGAIRNHTGYALNAPLRMELLLFGKNKKLLGSSLFHTSKKQVVRDNGVAIFDVFIETPSPASDILSYQYRILQ